MKFLFWIFIASLFYSVNLSAQKVDGYVYDEDKKPIPHANIHIEDTGIGTITNYDGYFTLNIPDGCSGQLLLVSCIGYEACQYRIAEITETIKVQLKTKHEELHEIVVFPEDEIFTLLTKAFKKIPDNYASAPSLLTGFYRDNDKIKGSPAFSFGEAVIECYKTSYKNKQNGQVRVLKSRKNADPNMIKTTNFKYYGGVFLPHFADIVHNREGAINPKNYKKFKYKYHGLVSNGNNGLAHKLAFESKKDDGHGIFYIDDNTLAFMQYEYYRKSYFPKGFRRNRSNFKVKLMYSKMKGTWFLKSVNYSYVDSLLTNNVAIEGDLEYVTTNVGLDHVAPIRYEEQVQYTDFFMDFATPYDAGFWKDYNIIVNDSARGAQMQNMSIAESDSLLNIRYETEKNTHEMIISFLKRTYYDFGLSYNNSQFGASSSQLEYDNLTVCNDKISSSFSNVLFSSLMGYKLTESFGIEYMNSVNISKEVAYVSNNFGISCLIPLKRGGKQFFAQASLSYFNKYGGNLIGFADMPGTTTISGKTFKKGANVYSGKKYKGISYGIIFKTNLTAVWHILAGVSYAHPLSTKDALLFRENKGVFRKKACRKLDDDIEYYENNKRTNQSSFELNNWNFTLGLRFEI